MSSEVLTPADQHYGGRTPVELINLYWEEVWNKGNVEVIRSICADPIVRHDIGTVTLLSHDEQIRRVTQQRGMFLPHFTHEVLTADDHHATSVWNMYTTDGSGLELCGIETFKAENGRFTDCWNAPYAKGRWGRLGDLGIPETLAPPQLLSSVEEIDHLWLQRIFHDAGVEVPRIAMVYRVEAIGNGTTSVTARLSFGYNVESGNSPLTLIAKFTSPRWADATDFLDFVGYEREVSAYQFFGRKPAFRIPQCYFAKFQAGSFNLILEDVAINSRAGDQLAGCNAADAAVVVRELGALHARYLGDAAVDTLLWPVKLSARASAFCGAYANGKKVIQDRFAHVLDPSFLAVIEEASDIVEPWCSAVPPVTTIIHGEARVDNVIFEGFEGDERACLIDLQQVAIGDPAFDIAYFLTGSLSSEDRSACERDLVAAHATELHKLHPEYSVDESWENYRENSVSGLFSTVAAAGLVEHNERNDLLITTLARRNCAAILELEGLAAARRRIDRPSG